MHIIKEYNAKHYLTKGQGARITVPVMRVFRPTLHVGNVEIKMTQSHVKVACICIYNTVEFHSILPACDL